MQHCSLPELNHHRCQGVYHKHALSAATDVTRWIARESATDNHLIPQEAMLDILVPVAWVGSDTVSFDDWLRVLETIGMIACPYSQGWGELVEDLMCIRGGVIAQGLSDWFAAVPLMVAILILHVLLYAQLVSIFIRAKRAEDGTDLLTGAQKAWRTTLRLMRRSHSLVFSSQPLSQKDTQNAASAATSPTMITRVMGSIEFAAQRMLTRFKA